jgi:hypothetical protein
VAARLAQAEVAEGTDGAVGRRWAAAGGSVEKGAGIPLGAPMTRRSPVGAQKNVIDVYWGPQEGGSDTMLNILYIEEEGERERRERAEANNGLHCIILIYQT